LNSEALLQGLRSVGERGLSFDLQLIPGLMEATSKILKDAPKTKVALCHAGSPHDRTTKGLEIYAEQLGYMSSLSNVTCKLSGLGMFDHGWTTDTIKTIIDICLKQFGENRCMFGSNFPVDSLYSNYDRLISSYKDIIPKECRSSVFEKVAQRFYF
jgi:predicted TIM-barrel fold metal-dependent hydrolase